MHLRVEYHDGRLEFEGAEDRLVAAFSAPVGPEATDPRVLVRRALEAPIDYPPLRQVVVPGDRVAVPIDPSLPDASEALVAIAEILADVGVESVGVIVDGRDRSRPAPECPPGVELVVHDPEDRESLAYLASTAGGRRIYLNRRLADADIVIPVGRIGPDDALCLRGPWSVIDPGLTDAGPGHPSLLAARQAEPPALAESIEVSWLLGSQFQVGAIPGESGLLHVVCGQPATVRDRGSALIDEAWGFSVDDRADLVIAGLGGPGRSALAEDLVEGLRQALRVVRRGGKVALLTRLGIDAVREAVRGPGLPRGDWAKALGWADVYLASASPSDEIDELGMIPLDRPEQAARLAATAPSFVAISQVDRVRASVRGEGGR
jgi:hypothetical protein